MDLRSIFTSENSGRGLNGLVLDIVLGSSGIYVDRREDLVTKSLKSHAVLVDVPNNYVSNGPGRWGLTDSVFRPPSKS